MLCLPKSRGAGPDAACKEAQQALRGAWGNAEQVPRSARIPLRAHRGVADARHCRGYDCALRLALPPACGRAHLRGLNQRCLSPSLSNAPRQLCQVLDLIGIHRKGLHYSAGSQSQCSTSAVLIFGGG